MTAVSSKPKRAKNSIAEFFRQTFRRHSGVEYSELLTRGMRGGFGVNKKYPWAYIRLFTLITVLFAVFLLIVRFTSNELFTPTITVLAAVSFNLPFLLLIYELYPERDISFMSVCLAMLIGGAAANIVTQILFNLFPAENVWLKAVYAGFFEELPKAFTVVISVVAARKDKPLAGFLMGAAIGCGFSIVEDMGYIFVQANEMPSMNLTTIIEVYISRGLSALCTHTVWTAAVGWAYCHFKRHFANIAFWLVTLLSCGLHISWDLPLDNLPLAFVYAGCVVVAGIECVAVLCVERKKVFGSALLAAEGGARQLDMFGALGLSRPNIDRDEEEEQSRIKTDPLYWRHWGNVTLALAAFLMAVVGILYCSLPFRETYGTEKFYDTTSFIAFMQDGMTFSAKHNRPYDDRNTQNDKTSPGRVTQSVTGDDGILYSYVYTENYDSYTKKYYYFPETVYATVTTESGTFTYNKEDIYNNGKLYASFFRVNDSVTGYNFDSDGDITVFIYNPAFVRDLSDWRYLSLFCTFAGIAGVSIVCYISFSIKSWRVKKLCSTKSVSSAK